MAIISVEDVTISERPGDLRINSVREEDFACHGGHSMDETGNEGTAGGLK